MPTYAGVVTQDELTAAALTVRAQAVSPNDNGRLSWPIFFPRQNVESTKINELTELDNRPVADRREWNARGRLIPMKAPDKRTLEIIPIESRDALSEQEMNRLAQEARGNEAIVQQVMGTRIPQRIERLASANYRRLEIDAFQVWTQGSIIQRNPETGGTYTTSFLIDSARLQTAGTAWNDAGTNAYNDFLAWYLEGVDEIGAAEGAMMRRATYNAIMDDAPNLSNNVAMTRTQIEDRISQDLGLGFRFYINENSLDVFDDGGTAVTRTKVYPADQVVLVPAGNAVGNAAFAPVVRAMDLARAAGDAGIDINGNTVYYEASNGGRQLDIECQLNALPVPNEQLVWAIDAGV